MYSLQFLISVLPYSELQQKHIILLKIKCLSGFAIQSTNSTALKSNMANSQAKNMNYDVVCRYDILKMEVGYYNLQ